MEQVVRDCWCELIGYRYGGSFGRVYTLMAMLLYCGSGANGKFYRKKERKKVNR